MRRPALLLSFPLALLAAAAVPSSRPAAAAGWASLGPDGATIRAVAVAPSNPQVVYAGGERGMFASTDGGATWRRATRGLPGATADDLHVAAVAVDAVRPATVYAGAAGGVFKSADGGASWRSIGPNPLVNNVLLAHPRAAGTLYAAGFGVFRTTDGGAHWTDVSAGLQLSSGVVSMVLDAASDTLYAALSERGVWKRVGDGAWQRTGGGTLDGADVTALALDPLRPRTLWASVSSGSVHRTTDGGASWSAVGRITAGEDRALALLFVPTRRSQLLAATDRGLFRSGDRGATWRPVELGIAARAFSLAYAPSDPGTVYAGTGQTGTEDGGGGVFRSRDGGLAWAYASRGLSTRSVVAVAADARRVWAGDLSSGLFLSPGRGARLQRLPAFPRTFVEGLDLDPRDPRTVAVAADVLHVTHDRGATWRTFDARAFRVAFDPQDPRTVYAGGIGVLKSTDRGHGYVRLASPELEIAVTVLAAALNSTVYAGGLTLSGPGGGLPPEGRLLRSRDGGATWRRIEAGLPPGRVLSLAVDPRDAATVYAGASEGLWKSEDGGGHWLDIARGLPDGAVVTALAVAPSSPDTLYAGLAPHGVWRSADGGASWAPLDGLSNLLILSLAVPPDDPGRVYAGTDGGGLFVWEARP